MEKRTVKLTSPIKQSTYQKIGHIQLVLEYQDSEPFDTGNLLIATIGDGHVRLDDILIKEA